MYDKEYYSLRHIIPETTPIPNGYIDYKYLKTPEVNMLNLRGHQIFINNLFNPTTPYKRLLIYHGTGTGKSLVINSLAKKYIDYFKKMKQQPQITIIGFTENIMVRELMKFPELGYIKQSEIVELDRLLLSRNERDIMRRRGIRANIKRRITDKSKGGYYKFYGYQEFSNDVFTITTKGIENNITIGKIYDEEGDFNKRIESLIKKEFIEPNRSLLNSLKYGVIACDEIHLVYNAQGKNNRGMAIKYVLDYLENEEEESAPRALFASATPISRSPTEAVDLLDLLVPKSKFNKLDYFTTTDPPKFKPDGLYKLGQEYKGYVSFLKDADEKIYPKRIIEGNEISGLPYLKFIECPMSSFQANTLREHKKHDPGFETLLSSESMTLYDMVFPNPSSNDIGLYNIGSLEGKLVNASEKWKQTTGIELRNNIPSGPFLNLDNLGIYSKKYETLVDELINILDSKDPGKIIIYHYFVRGSGVLLLRNMLLENGFVDSTSAPVNTTRCAVCGVIFKNHGKITDHSYTPARIIMAYGELGSGELENNYSLFNNVDNVNGYQYRILLGSRVIHEGVDFKEVRFMYILALPKDISTLIQVFGRAVRAYSHMRLPLNLRNVRIYILVSVFKNQPPIESPEIKNYSRKLKMFLLVQEVEREMRMYAIDNFINYDKMKHYDYGTLEGLPYKPAIKFDESRVKPADYISSFYNHGYANVEVSTLVILLKKLFVHCPIWTYSDLFKEIKNPKTLLNTPYNHSTFSETSFKIALDFLLQGISVKLNDVLNLTYTSVVPYINLGDEIRSVVYHKPYYILTATDDLGIPIIDYGQFMRSNDVEIATTVNVNKYIEDVVEREEYTHFLKEFMEKYEKFPEKSLIEILPTYHYILMREIITGKNKGRVAEVMKKVYIDLRLLFFYDDFIGIEIGSSYGITNKKSPIGYKAGSISYIFTENKFLEIQTSLFKLPDRKENDIIVGFLKIRNESTMEFIMRQPIQKLTLYTDRRKINKGAACHTYAVTERKKIINKLGITITPKSDVCKSIELNLFRREIKNRNGPRWFYLPMDILPIL